MFKKLSTILKTNIIEAPHPTLVAFGISAAIGVAVAVGIAMLTADNSHLAYARLPHIKESDPTIHILKGWEEG